MKVLGRSGVRVIAMVMTHTNIVNTIVAAQCCSDSASPSTHTYTIMVQKALSLSLGHLP